jgi:hypothetical protein
MKTRKTDNANLDGKLLLRRTMLDKYFGKKPFAVMDCCQGSQIIWGKLRREYNCRYMGVDVKPEAGRLKIDSLRLLPLNADKFDVIDIDTYGSPIPHMVALLPLIKKQVIIFLTYGQLWCTYQHDIKRILGFSFDIPNATGVALSKRLFSEILAGVVLPYANISECLEAPRSRNARYIGLVLTPHVGKK